ncbi:MAG TPA: tetratricopeptide repeat protein, partial [Longimicrobium sp.]|nr:tetratricopeptide repeat protein [Longimicrobium sp.]
MANPAKLRDQARAYEQRGQWRDAIDAYRELVEGQEGGDVDIATWNRIGDLHLRVNETEAAVQAYEAAVNAYVDVGLYNNAIALCRKILRLVPGRAQTYLRLGQISAAKGFFADARANFLEYAERMRKGGKLDASFAALKEFADLAPDPADVRRLLADQLLAHGKVNEAVEQLRLLLGIALAAGDPAHADELRRQILAADPHASTEPLTPQRAAAAPEELAYETGEYDPPPSAGGASTPAGLVGSDPAEFGNVQLDVQPLDGLEHTSLGDDGRRGGAAPAPASRADAPEAERDEGEDAGELPFIDFGAPGEAARGARGAT